MNVAGEQAALDHEQIVEKRETVWFKIHRLR